MAQSETCSKELKMKKIFVKIISFVAVLTICFSMFAIVGCGEENVGFSLSATELSVEEYESAVLTANLSEKVNFKSEDTSIATVDENGKIYGISKGVTYISVSSEKHTEKCKVIVLRNSTLPFIYVDKDYLKIEKGSSISVNASLKYKDTVLDVSLTATSANSAVSIVKDGNKFKVTGVETTAESVEIEISGEYLTKSFNKTIMVDVVESAGLYLTENSVTVHSFDNDGKLADKGYSRNHTLEYEFNSGFTASDVSWKSLDETIATVNDGVITGNREGKTQVYAYVLKDGKEYRSYCDVTVLVPVIKMEETFKLYKSSEDGNATVSFDGYSFFGQSAENIEVMVEDKVLDVSISSDEMIFDRNTLPSGEKTITVDIKGCVKYVFDAKIYSKIITTPSELLNLKTYGEYTDLGTWGENKGTKFTLDGYFALGGNIDLASSGIVKNMDGYNDHVTVNENGLALKKQPIEYGFIGTFDGQGYTIKNGTFAYGGLFGHVGLEGVIKNVAFSNAKLKTESDIYASVIASLFCGRLENVLIDVTSVENSVSWHLATGVSKVAIGASFVDCVVYYPQNNLFNGMYSYCVYVFDNFAQYMNGPAVTAENCYSISGGFTGQYSYEGKGFVGTSGLSLAFAQNVNAYTFGTTCDQIEWTELDTVNGYWVLTGDKATFKSLGN